MSRTIFVGNLPSAITKNKVEDLFCKYGNITGITVKIRYPLPSIAFIAYNSFRDAQEAIRNRNNFNYCGFCLRVEFYKGGRKGCAEYRLINSRRGGRRTEFRVIVSNLPRGCSWQDLKDFMRKAGDVVFADVEQSGDGVVDFSNRDDMLYAIKSMDDTEFKSFSGASTIRVKADNRMSGPNAHENLGRSISHSTSLFCPPYSPAISAQSANFGNLNVSEAVDLQQQQQQCEQLGLQSTHQPPGTTTWSSGADSGDRRAPAQDGTNNQSRSILSAGVLNEPSNNSAVTPTEPLALRIRKKMRQNRIESPDWLAEDDNTEVPRWITPTSLSSRSLDTATGSSSNSNKRNRADGNYIHEPSSVGRALFPRLDSSPFSPAISAQSANFGNLNALTPNVETAGEYREDLGFRGMQESREVYDFFYSEEYYKAVENEVPSYVSQDMFHVIGILPEVIDKEFDGEYLEYKAVGLALRNSPPAENLRKLLIAFYQDEWRLKPQTDSFHPRYFFGVIAPSGTGKTQTAFTLKSYGDFVVAHIVLNIPLLNGSPYAKNMQPIYQHASILLPSLYLNEAIGWDLNEIDALNIPVSNDATWTPAVEDLLPGGICEKWQLHTVMALSRMFNLLDKDEEHIVVAKDMRARLWEYVGARTRASDRNTFPLPVVVVDEALSYKDPDSTRRSSFLCAVLRAVGIASLFVGTNVEILKPPVPRELPCPARVIPTPWARLITLLPRTHYAGTLFEILNVRGKRATLNFLRALTEYAFTCTNSVQCFNALFSYRLWEYFLKDPTRTIDELRSKAAQHLYGEKRLLRTAAGVSAQLQYCLGETLGPEDEDFIHCHFARLEEEVDLNLTPGNQVVVKGTNKEWVPQLAFASPAVDPIGPLLLGGICTGRKHPAPFTLYTPVSIIRLTAAMAVQLCRKRLRKVHVGSNITEVSSTSYPHNFQESSMAAAAVCASQAWGISGVRAREFLLHFAAELLPSVPTQSLRWDPATPLEKWWSGADRLVPFCPGISTEAYLTSILPNIGRYERHAHRGGREGVHGMLRDSNQTALCTFESVPIATEENGDSSDACMPLRAAVTNFISHSSASLGVVVVSSFADSATACGARSNTNVVKLVVDQEKETVSIATIGTTDRVDTTKKSRIVCIFELIFKCVTGPEDSST